MLYTQHLQRAVIVHFATFSLYLDMRMTGEKSLQVVHVESVIVRR
jgi:hypothetical protein